VSAALERGVAVTVLPGPSAVETALVASGLAGDQYRFLGYLPRREAERDALWDELGRWPHPAVGFESPKRLPGALRSLAAALPDRRVAVCRELTKRFEEVVRGTAVAVAASFAEAPRGEITLVIDGASPELAGEASLDAAVSAVAELVAAGQPRRRAVDLVSSLTGLSRNVLYRASL
jgi:16S rRNA (cytidine1402-2'-O)-methyltransferase